MESSIVSVLDSLINTDGVKGVLVTDKHGLCLGEGLQILFVQVLFLQLQNMQSY
ncbi:14965_t:CDS:2 [Entrophospora sp. SA101]|nr:14965_t:CDS:2 [Entrophospora sp. SA101]